MIVYFNISRFCCWIYGTRGACDKFRLYSISYSSLYFNVMPSMLYHWSFYILAYQPVFESLSVLPCKLALGTKNQWLIFYYITFQCIILINNTNINSVRVCRIKKVQVFISFRTNWPNDKVALMWLPAFDCDCIFNITRRSFLQIYSTETP